MTVAELMAELKKMPSEKKVLLYMHLPNQDEGLLFDLIGEVFERDQEFVVLKSKQSDEIDKDLFYYCNCAFPTRNPDTNNCTGCGGSLL